VDPIWADEVGPSSTVKRFIVSRLIDVLSLALNSVHLDLRFPFSKRGMADFFRHPSKKSTGNPDDHIHIFLN
jgi:hypothetical protein